jgi:hypothetical protein
MLTGLARLHAVMGRPLCFWKMENRKTKATHGLLIACAKTF